MSVSPTIYPRQLAIEPLDQPPAHAVTVPGSKSITNRALVLAALTSRGECIELSGALHSEDTEVMVDALVALGFEVGPDWSRNAIQVRAPRDGRGSPIPAAAADLFVANSGTSMRFLTALVALGRGTYRLDGVPRMRERPIDDLLAALRQLGVEATSDNNTGCPPVTIHSHGLNGGPVSIRADISSQFLSGLLMAAPFAGSDIVLSIDGPLVSRPYVDLTLAMVRDFSLTLHEESAGKFHIPAPQHDVPSRAAYAIEPDASAASYFWAAAAITDGSVEVLGLTSKSLQGDVRFVEALAQMGCVVEERQTGILVQGRPLHGIDIDMNDISDTVMTLGAVACFADGPTTIRNVAHVRHKETDRLAALAMELRRLGAGVDEWDDGLRITPGQLRGATVQTYQDHRMAMSLALVGLVVPGVIIDNPGCVAKTYPAFFSDLDKLRQREGTW